MSFKYFFVSRTAEDLSVNDKVQKLAFVPTLLKKETEQDEENNWIKRVITDRHDSNQKPFIIADY